jgi:hypothetical protein
MCCYLIYPWLTLSTTTVRLVTRTSTNIEHNITSSSIYFTVRLCLLNVVTVAYHGLSVCLTNIPTIQRHGTEECNRTLMFSAMFSRCELKNCIISLGKDAKTMKIRSAVISLLVALSQADTSVPTQAPSAANGTVAPSQSNVPTALTNSSAPSTAPSSVVPANTTQPTVSPSPTTVSWPTLFPTPAPSESNSTEPPSVAPTATETTVPQTASPTTSPSASPSLDPNVPTKPHRSSIGKIIAKTIGWLILIALSVLGFGAAMSNRYQIYYALRGVWYTILQMECTRWIVTKLNLGGGGRGGRGANSSLNEIIFDNNDLTEGLLMGDT